MTVLSAQSIRFIRPIDPFCERTVFEGMTYGLGPASYDVRIAEDVILHPGQFCLASTIEEFRMPTHICASVRDKSTWARRGLALQNTFIDPGWRGFLTLELTSHRPSIIFDHTPAQRGHIAFGSPIRIKAGMPIAQIVFERLDEATDIPYNGKYQNQEAGPQANRYERKS